MVILTREQIEQRLVALHRASLELVSDLSLETVLERIVHTARELAGARYAALGVIGEDGHFEKFIPAGLDREQMEKIGAPPKGHGLLNSTKWGRSAVRTAKISSDKRSAGFPPHHPEMDSFLGVPILLGDNLLGQIYLTNKEDYFEFTEDDERVIETLAAYAAVAISNARLYQDLIEQDKELGQRNEDMALLNDIASALTGSLDLEEILDRTLNRVIAYLAVEAGEIFLSENSGRELRLAMHRGEASNAFCTKDRFMLGEGFVGIVAATGKPLVTDRLGEDSNFLRPAVVEAGFHCLASIPMAARGNVIGVMNVATRQKRMLTQRELHLLTSIGAWAGITIENAQLHHQAQRVAVLEERDRIAMDLHDGIIQSIYAVGLALDFARKALEEDPEQSRRKIDQAVEGLNSAIGDIRSYISDLRPRQFDGKNLMEGLQRLIDEYIMNTRSQAILQVTKEDLSRLSPAHATALFHICQEALANIAKHARSEEAFVQVWTAQDRVLLEVTDTGRGFDLRNMSVTLGHGLSNMHTRAHKVGGDVEITSEPGQGTTVLAWVPMCE
jgi:two-component system, NarL family, sensor histidine kinase DevS